MERRICVLGFNTLYNVEMKTNEPTLQELLEKFKELDVCCVSDAMDKLGVPCGLEGIKAIVPGKTICGAAFTVHYVPCGIEKGTVGDFLDDVQPGQVVVIDNAGRTYCTVWGGIMSKYAEKLGIEGTIIDGVCRDVPIIKETNYKIFTKGHYMVTGKDRVEIDAVNVPISISGVQIKPDDIILGDDTGVVAIPKEIAQKVLSIASEISEKESKIEEYTKQGATLSNAREKFNYHTLQTKS